MNYKHFQKYIIRTPVNPLEDLINQENINLDFFVDKKDFLQAVRLSSPSLYNQYEKWSKNKLKNKKDNERLLISLLKYYTRSCTRCTPFGLFAGLNIGDISNDTNIILKSKYTYTPHTRLDMNYLCALIQDLENETTIRNKLTYYVNNSLYIIADKIRFIEFYYVNNKRKHQISESSYNKYLQLVINKALQGATISELSSILILNDISNKEANIYINELINNQVLVSELNPTITGNELMDSLISKLKKLNISNLNILQKLEEIRIDIENLDKQKTGNSINFYSKITKKVETINTKFDEKYLFQTDLKTTFQQNTINEKIFEEIYQSLNILNKLTFKPSDNNLQKFKEAFYKRYEEQEIPLAMALDIETGIGYLQNNDVVNGDITPLLDNIFIPRKQIKTQSRKINWNEIQSFLLKKYIKAVKEKQNFIEIYDNELTDFQNDWSDLPDTFSVKTEILKKNNHLKIHISSVGGSSAVNLLGRFAHSNKEIHKFINDIVEKENQLNTNSILAEIVHLPESRVGNILSRPVFRTYEIPYLANSSVDIKYQININDIMISIRQNKILLRSKKHNKKIIPYLGNAHNFSNNALPIYQFLADMQIQNKRGGLYFFWGNLENEFDYFPRVVYKNTILSLETWFVKHNEIKEIIKQKNDTELKKQFDKFKIKRKLSQYVALSDKDNKLFINTEKILHIKMLLSLVKNRSYFKLQEFLFSGDTFVKDVNNKSYANEIIFSFHKNNKIDGN